MRFSELTEQADPVDDETLDIIKSFVDFASSKLGIDTKPQIKLITDPKQASMRKSFGGYMGDRIELNIANRHIMDVMRTMAHELVHYKQDLDGVLHKDSGKDGSEHENEANAKAAVIMRLWGKMNPELFQHAALLAEAWSRKYKKSINCSNPKGFSQRAHCQGRKKNEGKDEFHISPSGVKTSMPKDDDDYNINYGKNGLVAKFRKERGLDVKTGSRKVNK